MKSSWRKKLVFPHGGSAQEPPREHWSASLNHGSYVAVVLRMPFVPIISTAHGALASGRVAAADAAAAAVSQPPSRSTRRNMARNDAVSAPPIRRPSDSACDSIRAQSECGSCAALARRLRTQVQSIDALSALARLCSEVTAESSSSSLNGAAPLGLGRLLHSVGSTDRLLPSTGSVGRFAGDRSLSPSFPIDNLFCPARLPPGRH